MYAEADDLDVIKAAAAREGVSEAEIIRDAIHRAALAKRTWDQPIQWTVHHGDGTLAREDSLDDVFAAEYAKYRRHAEERRAAKRGSAA